MQIFASMEDGRSSDKSSQMRIAESARTDATTSEELELRPQA
jgi:hypothetical protein